jgi:uncharacterized cupredoxin-like copper-binding protein
MFRLPGAALAVTLALAAAPAQAARHEFYSSMPGHEQAGMKGTLVVS